MSKFAKRLRKTLGRLENCLVVGHGFGKMEDLFEIFNTVFLIKSKKLIYRENYDDLNQISELSVIFFDVDQIKEFKSVLPLVYKFKPYVIVEGSDIRDRNYFKDLYENRYQAIEIHSTHHLWKL
jgi:hypothetical protein